MSWIELVVVVGALLDIDLDKAKSLVDAAEKDFRGTFHRPAFSVAGPHGTLRPDAKLEFLKECRMWTETYGLVN